jgi:hypothetical protein
MELQSCVRCGSVLRAPQGINQTGDPAIAVYVIAKTVGIRPRATSPAKRKVFCVPCAVSIAFGPSPENGAFNEAIYGMLLDLIAQSRKINDVAWEQKVNPPARPKLMPGSRPDPTLEAPLLSAPAIPQAS